MMSHDCDSNSSTSWLSEFSMTIKQGHHVVALCDLLQDSQLTLLVDTWPRRSGDYETLQHCNCKPGAQDPDLDYKTAAMLQQQEHKIQERVISTIHSILWQVQKVTEQVVVNQGAPVCVCILKMYCPYSKIIISV